MNTIKLLFVGNIIMILVATYVYSTNPTVDDDTPADSAGMLVVTHDDALFACEEMGLTYDYEAEGTTPDEFCK